jgi:hypothetical protein
VSSLIEWANRRWIDRFPEDDNPGLQVGDEMVVFSACARDVEERRVALYATLGSIGADEAVLRELDAFEAACGVLGVVIGSAMETEPVDAHPPTSDEIR